MSAAASQLRPILCSSAVVELVLKRPSARRRRPCDRQASTEAHSAVMHAESSWVNLRVTASSISCLTSFLTAPTRRAFSSSAPASGPMAATGGGSGDSTGGALSATCRCSPTPPHRPLRPHRIARIAAARRAGRLGDPCDGPSTGELRPAHCARRRSMPVKRRRQRRRPTRWAAAPRASDVRGIEPRPAAACCSSAAGRTRSMTDGTHTYMSHTAYPAARV